MLRTNLSSFRRHIVPFKTAQTQEIEYDASFDDVLRRIAEKRCQVSHLLIVHDLLQLKVHRADGGSTE